LSLAAIAGEALFNDKSLSASGKQSCATCHVASRAFTADPATDQGLPVPLGGADMDIPGFRNTPSLSYVSLTPGFFLDDGTPTGGFFRDGRASSLDVQAQLPFITPFEMGNRDLAEVVGRLQQSPASLQAFIAAYGAQALNDPKVALADIGLAIAAFETEDAAFHPFSSKFDYWQAGKVELTPVELQGLALFNNPGKGNCPMGIHISPWGRFTSMRMALPICTSTTTCLLLLMRTSTSARCRTRPRRFPAGSHQRSRRQR
jgi:cytochrome c peroxidase